MKKFYLWMLLMLGLVQYTSAQELKTKPFTIGESIEFSSKELKEQRTLNVYLPQGYEAKGKKKYPVIYLLDGSAEEDFIHVAGLVQFGSFPWVNYVPESIVVGIANVDRRRDYTYPTTVKKDKEDFPTTGKSANFINYLGKEVIPLIEANYQTDTIRTIIGQSLGGLLATEILLKKPFLFTHYIIVSPSLWWDKESLLKVKPALYAPRNVYVAVGKEGEVMERATKELTQLLQPINKVNISISLILTMAIFCIWQFIMLSKSYTLRNRINNQRSEVKIIKVGSYDSIHLLTNPSSI